MLSHAQSYGVTRSGSTSKLGDYSLFLFLHARWHLAAFYCGGCALFQLGGLCARLWGHIYIYIGCFPTDTSAAGLPCALRLVDTSVKHIYSCCFFRVHFARSSKLGYQTTQHHRNPAKGAGCEAIISQCQRRRFKNEHCRAQNMPRYPWSLGLRLKAW